jgi:hypothetical protein
MSFITKQQFEELENTRIYGTREEFHRLLERYTDIVAHPFVSYIYADCADNYVGDSENFDLRDLLANAYIEVRSDTE